MSLRALRRRCGGSLPHPGAGRSGDALYCITAGGMWADDASGEVENRVLQGQQAYWCLSERAIYVSGLHVRAQGGAQSTQPAIYRLPAGGEWRRAQTDEAGGAGLAGPSPDPSDA